MRAGRITGVFVLASTLLAGCAEEGEEDIALGAARWALVAEGVQLCLGRRGRERCMSLNPHNASLELRKRRPGHARQEFDVIEVHDHLHEIGYGGEGYNCLDVPLFQQDGLVGLAACIASPLDPRAAAQLWTLEAVAETSTMQIRNGVSPDFCLAAVRQASRETVVGIARCNESPEPAQRWTIRALSSHEEDEDAESASLEEAEGDAPREDDVPDDG